MTIKNMILPKIYLIFKYSIINNSIRIINYIIIQIVMYKIKIMMHYEQIVSLLEILVFHKLRQYVLIGIRQYM
jgi:hypothetical protein